MKFLMLDASAETSETAPLLNVEFSDKEFLLVSSKTELKPGTRVDKNYSEKNIILKKNGNQVSAFLIKNGQIDREISLTTVLNKKELEALQEFPFPRDQKKFEPIKRAEYDKNLISKILYQCEPPVSFTEKSDNCFKGMKIEDLQSTVWLGHSGEDEVGDFNAEEFAKKFEAQFRQAGLTENEKVKVENLNFVSCEIAFQKDSKKPSIAQSIVKELANKGFINAKVHAITPPPGDYAGMRVEVITKPAAAQLYGVEPGAIVAYVLPKVKSSTAKEIDLDKALSKQQKLYNEAQDTTERQKAKLAIESIKQQAIVFVSTNNGFVEFKRPHNVITASNSTTRPQKSLETEFVLNDLDRYLMCPGLITDKNDIKLFEDLKIAIGNDGSNNWRKHIQACIDKNFKGFNMGAISRMVGISTPYAILNDLLENGPQKAQEMMPAGVQPKEEKKKTGIMELIWSKLPAAVKSLLEELKRKVAGTRGMPQEKVLVHGVPKEMQDALNSLSKFTEMLKEEDDNKKAWLQKKHLSFFSTNTKKNKREILAKLCEDIEQVYDKHMFDKESPEAWQKKVMDEVLEVVKTTFEQNKKVLTQRIFPFRASRTEILLNNILQHKPENGIERYRKWDMPADPSNKPRFW